MGVALVALARRPGTGGAALVAMPRRGNNTGTVYWAGRLKWIVRMPDHIGAGASRSGYPTREAATAVLEEALATGIVPPPRPARSRRVLAETPLVTLGADDFVWARRMVSSLARKHEYLRDDIEAEAMLATHLASLDYRPGGNHFRSYAAMKIRGAVVDFLRTQNRSLRNVDHLKEPERHKPARIVDLDEQQWGRLPANNIDLDEMLDERQHRRHFDSMIAGLPERHASMARMYVIDGLSMRDVGAAFGVTESRVCQIVKAALEKIAGKKISLSHHKRAAA